MDQKKKTMPGGQIRGTQPREDSKPSIRKPPGWFKHIKRRGANDEREFNHNSEWKTT